MKIKNLFDLSIQVRFDALFMVDHDAGQHLFRKNNFSFQRSEIFRNLKLD